MVSDSMQNDDGQGRLERHTINLYKMDVKHIQGLVKDRRYISLTEFVRQAVQEKLQRESKGTVY
jgi:Arc/MetJ-type ribon-helix-helix transcriptional regulator